MANWFDEQKGMADLFSDPALFYDRINAQQRGIQSNQLGLESQTLANQFEQQMNPLRVRKQQADINTSEAQLPGIIAESELTRNKADISRQTKGLQLSAAQKKLITAMSDDDVKVIKNQAQQMALSPDPQVRAQGMKLMEGYEAVVTEKSKQQYMSERQMELEKLRGKNALAVANAQQAGATARKGMGGKGVGAASIVGKMGLEKAIVYYTMKAQEAEADGDVEEAAKNYNLANQFREQFLAGKTAASGQAGTQRVDPRSLIPQAQTFPAPVVPSITSPTGKGTTGVVRPPGDTGVDKPDSTAIYKQAFGAYEPDKYEYRMGPNGVPQRRKK